MINLIPASAKKRIRTEYWVRVLSVGLFILSIVFIVVSLLMLPVYVLVTSQVTTYASSADEALEKVADYDISALALKKANNQAQMLIGIRDVKPFSELFTKIDSFSSDELIVSEFQFSRDGVKLKTVRLVGEASTRQALSSFRDSLLDLPEVSDVNLPISNLAKDRDISFSLTVTLNDVGN